MSKNSISEWGDWFSKWQSYSMPVKNWHYRMDHPDVRNAFENEQFRKAGGHIVIGEPWKGEWHTDSEEARVYFQWEDYYGPNGFVHQLTEQVQQFGKKFDAVISMPRWGVGAWAMMANSLWIPLGYAHATSYTWQQSGTLHEWEISIPEWVPPGWRILLVDDLADSGKALNATKKRLEELGYTVETAVIFKKTCSEHEPDFCLFRDYPPIWIVQPDEGFENGLPFGHNVGWWKENPISKIILETALKIKSYLDTIQTIAWNNQKIRYHVWSEHLSPYIASWVSRLLDQMWIKMDYVFSSSAERKHPKSGNLEMSLSNGWFIDITMPDLSMRYTYIDLQVSKIPEHILSHAKEIIIQVSWRSPDSDLLTILSKVQRVLGGRKFIFDPNPAEAHMNMEISYSLQEGSTLRINLLSI